MMSLDANDRIETVEDLEERLSRPTPEVEETLAQANGDLLILGAGGKMGPTLAKMAARALRASGSTHQVHAVSRFTQPGLIENLEQSGVRAISADLLNRDEIARLPDAPLIVFMAGKKFGSTGSEGSLWAMNAWLPGLVAERYKESRFVVFSSGNVYPFSPVAHVGATEKTPLEPIGEYAQSVMARERLFQYFSERYGTAVAFFRLNYAVELRYGVLLDIARAVYERRPLNVTMGYVNVIWQGDANAYALRSLSLANSPPTPLNVTGPETLSVRGLAERFGELFETKPILEGEESPTALLSDAGRAFELFGYPSVSLETLIRWVAHWVRIGGTTLDKPTHFETRDGKF